MFRSVLLIFMSLLVFSSMLVAQVDKDVAQAPTEPAVTGTAKDDETSTGSRKLQVTRKYLLDIRYMKGNMENKLEPMSVEMELTGTWGDKLDFALQVPFYTPMHGRARGMHYGNAYVIVKGEVGKPTLKIGQFVIPFGNLVDYETHTRPFQTLYRYSLGGRIDPGVEVEGYLGENEWQAAVTTGNGPWRTDNNGNKVITGRISRKMQVGEDDLRVGISILRGKLPVFPILYDPIMQSREADAGMTWAMKNRAAVDIEYYRGIDLIRAEVVAGTDDGEFVNGQWVQVEHPLNYTTSLVGFAERWKQNDGSMWGGGVGIEKKLKNNATVRLTYEIHRSRDDMGMSMKDNMFTGQYLIEF